MKKLFIVALAVGLLGALALPALAQSTTPPGQDPDLCDVSFNVDVLKLKGILITKVVNKTFNFNLDLGVEIVGFPQWAEVEAYKCDHNEDNQAAISGIVSTANIQNSFNAFIGVAQVNQASGYLNNQGNILAAGLTGKIGDQQTFGISMVEAAVEKTNRNNQLALTDNVTTDNIQDSFNAFQGLAQVNQASGHLNNQNNVVVLGTNLNTSGLSAENDTFLSMSNTDNLLSVSATANVPASGVISTSNIMDSYNAFTGVAQVNQTSGALNNQTNITSIAYAGR
jgi:hypothetical protein